MIVRKATPGDLPAIAALAERAFGEPRPLDFWEWKSANGRHSWVAEHRSEIVGHSMSVPLELIASGGKRIAVLLSVETAVDPRFQSRGILRRLFEEITLVGASEGACALIGIPNEGWGAHIQNLWEPMGTLEWRARVLRPEAILPKRLRGGLSTRRLWASPIGAIPNWFSPFAPNRSRNPIAATAFGKVARTQDWMTWRFASAPTEYCTHRRSTEDNGTQSVVTAMPTPDRGMIADLSGTSPEALAPLVHAACQALHDQGADVVWALSTPQSSETAALVRNGFFRIRRPGFTVRMILFDRASLTNRARPLGWNRERCAGLPELDAETTALLRTQDAWSFSAGNFDLA